MLIAQTESKHRVKLATEHAPYTKVGANNIKPENNNVRVFIFSLPIKYTKKHILNQRKNSDIFDNKKCGHNIIFYAKLSKRREKF